MLCNQHYYSWWFLPFLLLCLIVCVCACLCVRMSTNRPYTYSSICIQLYIYVDALRRDWTENALDTRSLLLSTITSQHQVSWDCLYKILVAEALCAVQQRPILPSSFSLSATCDCVLYISVCVWECVEGKSTVSGTRLVFFTNRLVWEGIGIEWSEREEKRRVLYGDTKKIELDVMDLLGLARL